MTNDADLRDAAVQFLVTQAVKKKLKAKAKRNGRSLSGYCSYVLTQDVQKA